MTSVFEGCRPHRGSIIKASDKYSDLPELFYREQWTRRRSGRIAEDRLEGLDVAVEKHCSQCSQQAWAEQATTQIIINERLRGKSSWRY